MSKSRPSARVHHDHAGRVVLVTGGSGGIGRAICEAFALSGASVVNLDVQTPDWQQDGVSFEHCDTSSDGACREAVEQAVMRFKGIDVLVNNAAIQPVTSYRPIHQLDDEVVQKMYEVNLRGYLRMAQLVIPCMLRQGSGVVVNIASGQAHRTARQVGVYGPIKSANVMQARQWGIEYARSGIRVVSVSPGAIDTPLVRASLSAQGGGASLANRHPLGRIGRPEEVAAAVLWLCSDDASFVTATDLEVDGGLGAFGAFAEPYRMDDV